MVKTYMKHLLIFYDLYYLPPVIFFDLNQLKKYTTTTIYTMIDYDSFIVNVSMCINQYQMSNVIINLIAKSKVSLSLS